MVCAVLHLGVSFRFIGRKEEADVAVMDAMAQLNVARDSAVRLNRWPQLAQQLVRIAVALPPPDLHRTVLHAQFNHDFQSDCESCGASGTSRGCA